MKKVLFLSLILSACSVFAKEIRFDLYLSQGSMFENVVLKKLQEDTLFYVQETSEKRIHLSELMKMFKIRQSKFWKDAGIGFVSGAAVGGIIGRASYKKPEPDGFITLDFGPGLPTFGGAFLGGGVGFFIGGIIGSSRKGSKKEYDLSGFTIEQKRTVIKAILENKM